MSSMVLFIMLTPLALFICLFIGADVCAVFRFESAALVVLIYGNLYLGTVIAIIGMAHHEESLCDGLLCTHCDSDQRVDHAM